MANSSVILVLKKGKQAGNAGMTIYYEIISLFLYCFYSFFDILRQLIGKKNWYYIEELPC